MTGRLTPDIVSRMFPGTPRRHIDDNLPHVLEALASAQLDDEQMLLMALGTIRAETAGFVPISEGVSKFNTSPGGHPFDLYDHRQDLGNQGPPDGEQYRGRGFVQLTGRANYLTHGKAIGVDLVTAPDQANDPAIAARLLASFLKSKEPRIRAALAINDLATARRLVNGGSHGLDTFSATFNSGKQILSMAA
jgi:putative chitinase